jgi:hypothetical protein
MIDRLIHAVLPAVVVVCVTVLAALGRIEGATALAVIGGAAGYGAIAVVGSKTT